LEVLVAILEVVDTGDTTVFVNFDSRHSGLSDNLETLGLLALIAAALIGVAAAQPGSQVERKTMERVSEVSLSAQHTVSTNEVRIHYTIKNGTSGDIYVLDGMPARNPSTREPVVAVGDYSLFLREPGEALILVGIPPLPKGKLVTVRNMPLATKVASGAIFTQNLLPIALPLTERSPYMTAEELRLMEATTVQRLALVDEGAAVGRHVDERAHRQLPHGAVDGPEVGRQLVERLHRAFGHLEPPAHRLGPEAEGLELVDEIAVHL
jgi:hypothetical protein